MLRSHHHFSHPTSDTCIDFFFFFSFKHRSPTRQKWTKQNKLAQCAVPLPLHSLPSESATDRNSLSLPHIAIFSFQPAIWPFVHSRHAGEDEGWESGRGVGQRHKDSQV